MGAWKRCTSCNGIVDVLVVMDKDGVVEPAKEAWLCKHPSKDGCKALRVVPKEVLAIPSRWQVHALEFGKWLEAQESPIFETRNEEDEPAERFVFIAQGSIARPGMIAVLIKALIKKLEATHQLVVGDSASLHDAAKFFNDLEKGRYH